MWGFHLNKYYKSSSVLLVVVALLFVVAQQTTYAQESQDTTHGIIYPIPIDNGNPYNQLDQQSPMYLQDPPNIKREIVYNPATGQYDFVSKVGDFEYRTPTTMDAKEYLNYQNKKGQQSYWNTRKKSTETNDGSIIPAIYVGGKAFDMIFGGNTIDIRPQGSAEISFGIKHNKRDDPRLNVRQRSVTNFDFNQKIQMNVIAKIGEKIDFKISYNTEATFEFENKMKLQYTGNEDEIIKLIEAGNVSFPLNSTLIRGSQALFGVKTQLQFGRTTVTALFSEQESESKNITVQGGAQTNEFNLTAIDYEENRHFFLSQYFRDKYEDALETLPVVTSDVNITKIEVWITNKGAALENNRNILAFTDLGEAKNDWLFNREVHPAFGSTLPANKANDLITRLDTSAVRSINSISSYLTGDPFRIGKTGYLVSGQDFEKLENARKLNASEYTLNSKLGFISLNTAITADQTIAVAYQYTVIGHNEVFQVGEFSDQGINAPKVLLAKLLKSTTLNTRMPMWNLMMKNVYSIRAYQVNREDFTFNILYSGNENGVPTGYFTEGNENIKGVPLIHLLNLDNLNQQNNPVQGGDGIFDFIDNAASSGGTINASNGRIYFTVLEPFGSYIREKVFNNDINLANKYAFDSLYTLTKTAAEQYTDKNKFVLEGYYKSQSGSEISLNALNVPQGSVKVTAGGVPLTENVDYTVDYTLGRVSIINEGILNSGTPINISLENNSMFNLQKKRMMGLRVEHVFDENFRIGGTLLNLRERPLTQKVNYGDDPINNTIYGFDVSYRTESRWLTKMIDKIPGINTKQISTISFDGEFAHFLPGYSRAVGSGGTSYIDDFEGAKSTIDLRQFHNWYMASTPQGQTDKFPEAAPGTGLDYGKNRAKLAWYVIDPLFYDRYGTLRPGNVDKNELSKHSSRQILEQELFPNKQVQSGISTNISVLNLAYFPSERAPYNYDVRPTSYTSGMEEDGSLANPHTRWGGIMRPLESTDFEATNIEYLEFWMMDPFIDDPNNSGELYFNLGDISEDILRDGRKSYENGLPSTAEVMNVDTTIWGRVPILQAIVEVFNNDPASRKYQDIGYDGLNDEDETSFFKGTFLDAIQEIYGIGSKAYELAAKDPSADNFHYFRGSDYDSDSRYGSITERYKNYNGPDGNSPTDEQNTESYSTSSTTLPNVEDINKDNTLGESERYFQYEVKIEPNKMNVGENYIADIHTTNVTLANGQREEVTWYQFRIPINQPDKVIGNIEDFRSIRFMRMFLKGFEKEKVLRFATLELVRGEWRTYTHNIQAPGEYIPSDAANETKFNISAVNYEENGNRTPIPYQIPSGIDQEVYYGTTSLVRMNEQSMMLTVQNLLDGDARAAYKTTGFDFRQYKKLKMYVHAEKYAETDHLEDGDVSIFIRMGSDFTENYYEYEIPLKLTPWHTSDADLIWPEENRFDIDLDELVNVKQRRNKSLQETNTTVRVNYLYTEQYDSHQIKVIGNPSVSDIKGMMIGIRNPKKIGVQSTDDGSPKNVIVWVNELRLTDFDNSGGWAATGRVEAMLADLGRVSFSGSHSSAGFGSLDMKVNEVSLESTTSFDVSTDIDLGKFLPETTGIKIPMHFDYGETHINPKYNPLNPDVTMKDELDALNTKSQKDSLKALVNDFSLRKNINFINVRKERTGKNPKVRIYDIENINVSYSYSEAYNRNIDIEYYTRKLYRGGLAYNYVSNPKNVTPFAKWKIINSPSMQLLKDFNFYYLPKSLSFRTEMNRRYDEKKFRTKSQGDIITYPTYAKEWDWTRDYTFQYDITRGLKLDFAAGANAYIYEPGGNPDRGSVAWKANRDTIIDEILNFGTKTRYAQTVKLNYTVPINKIPIFNWISATAIYQGGYTWLASASSVQDRIGNSIENENTKQINGNLDFTRLYNKVPYLKQLNTPRRTNTRGETTPRQGAARPQQNEASADSTQQKSSVNYFKIVGDQLLKLAMSVKRANINYTQKNGQYLPGFMHEPDLFGLNFANSSPGFAFAFGGEADIRHNAIANNWLTMDSLLNSPYAKKYTETFNYRINVEPLPGMKIDISADRSYAENFEEYFRADANGVIQSYTPTRVGNFSMSYGLWKTSFTGSRKDENSSLFDDLLSNRKIIAERLANNNAQWIAEGSHYFYDSIAKDYYPYGYGSTSQEVVMYSFLAAYRGGDASKITLNPFPNIPIPNWSINYNGLTNIPAVQKLFKTVNLTHAYRSSYTINSYASNVSYDPNNTTQVYENTNLFITKYDIAQIVLSEQFSPLFGIDIGFHNSLTARFEFKKTRSLTLSFTNNQLTEVNGQEIIIGTGYRIRNLTIFNANSRNSRTSNDLVLKVDLGFRNDKTILRRIDENNNQISAGQEKINLYITADYTFSSRLTGQVFFKRDVTDPFVSAQFKTTSTFAGFTLRFNLAQ
ncbi:MAG: cell surface protein SprA [Lentimicrobiaceae bacterium]|jgi:cell surface protein SprA|nr:cell surface protein SprA [Lentimicrobiaceae bacterium]